MTFYHLCALISKGKSNISLEMNKRTQILCTSHLSYEVLLGNLKESRRLQETWTLKKGVNVMPCVEETSRKMFFLIVFPFASLHERPVQLLTNWLPLPQWLPTHKKNRKENVIPSNDTTDFMSSLHHIPEQHQFQQLMWLAIENTTGISRLGWQRVSMDYLFPDTSGFPPAQKMLIPVLQLQIIFSVS